MAQENNRTDTSRRKIGKRVVRRVGGIDTQQQQQNQQQAAAPAAQTATATTTTTTTTTTTAELYGYRISWQPTEQTFVATCLEFPTIRAVHSTSNGALAAAHQQVAQHISHSEAEGQEVPEPLSARHYSGKLQVRLGEDLHRVLAQQAAENGMSLNQLILKKLSAG